MASIVFFAPVLILLIALIALSVRILREYERGVVFTLGRFTGVKGPGLILLLPYVQQMVRVDQRTIVFDVPSQDVISRDNVSVKVNAVIYFRVMDAESAVIQVENFRQATSELAQTTLRSVLGKHDLDEMLSERDKLNHDIQEILDTQTDAWGIKVANVEIKHIDIDESMIRVIARQAEAERERRAKVINAEGEQQAAQKLLEAAQILAQSPEAMQLRYLSTLTVIGSQNNSTIVFPFPTDIGVTLSRLLDTAGGADAAGGRRTGRPDPRGAATTGAPIATGTGEGEGVGPIV
jgi:regulator of protease activity HflC (stomatin/prohibitin superfamily)